MYGLFQVALPEMMRWHTLALLLLALPLLDCSLVTASYDPPAFSGWTEVPVDYQGFRFVDKTKDASPVAVPGLVPGCGVRFEQGKSLPADRKRDTLQRWGQACSHPRAAPFPGPAASTNAAADCGSSLSNEQILAVADRALRAQWGDYSLENYRTGIQEHGCDYVFTAVRLDPLAAEDIVIVIDRAGRVKNFPLCCRLGDCPSLCSEDPPKKEAGRS